MRFKVHWAHTAIVFIALALGLSAAAIARQVTFAWDASPTWPAGTTVELEANGASANGITATTHTLDVPVNPGELINARARAIPPAGYECGDPLASCPPSPWSESLIATLPPDPTGLQATIERIGGGGVMAAPTFVAQYPSTWVSGSTTKTAMNAVSINANDVVIFGSCQENNLYTLGENENGAGSFTLQQDIGIELFAYSPIRLLTYISPSSESLTVNVTNSSTGQHYGGNAVRFSGSDGVGASASSSGSSGYPSVNLTTTQANSAIFVIVGDWNAISGTQTFSSSGGAGSPTDLTSYPGDSSTYGVHVAYYADAGAVGTKTISMTAPTNMKWTIAAVEVKGSAGATTNTSTTSINALVQKTGITATSSLSALLQKSFSGNVSIDSLVAAIKSGSLTLDSLIKAVDKNSTTSVDGLIQAVVTGAVSIDAAIAVILASTTGIDSLLQKAFASTTSLDAILSGGSSVSASLDGLLQSGKSTTALLDALLQAGYLSQASIDAFIADSFNATSSLDALVKKGLSTSAVLDAIISGGSAATVSLDAFLQAGFVSSASIDGLLKKSASSTISADALIKGSRSAVAALDGLVQGAKTGTLSLDAIIVSAGEALATTSLDGLVQALKSGSLSLDAMVAVPMAGTTAGLDALLFVTGTDTVSVDALLQAVRASILSIDGLVQSAKTAQVSIDGLVQSARTGTVSLDAVVGVIGSAAISLDGILQKSRASGVFIDAIIGLISAIIMPTGRVISIAPTDRFIVISETDRFIVIPNSDRSVVN